MSAMIAVSDVVTPILQGVAGNIQGSLLNIGASAVVVGAVVLGLRKGWPVVPALGQWRREAIHR